jgi:hypothetical protein
MDEKENRRQGEELNQLSRLVFRRATRFWYSAISIELAAGILGVGALIARPTQNWELLLAIVGFILFATAYYLKIVFDRRYEDAETMRRQSVLTEALNWPINRTQFSEWRLRAGRSLLREFEVESRDPDYYETQAVTGPKRLTEMTIESAFYTRHLYIEARKGVWIIFAVAAILIVGFMALAALPALPPKSSFWVTYFIFALLPVLLSIDLLYWGIKLNRLIYSLCRIEEGLDRIKEEERTELPQVLRLVAEYNCQVVRGFPIPDWFFNRHHDTIKALWNKRGL